jgi:indole-3-glycerol phosphate synthase
MTEPGSARVWQMTPLPPGLKTCPTQPEIFPGAFRQMHFVGAGRDLCRGPKLAIRGAAPTLTLVSWEDYSESLSISNLCRGIAGLNMTDLAGTKLGEIVARRKSALAQAKAQRPLEAIQLAAEMRHEWRDFAAALSAEGLQVIAELKQASPSRGVLRKDFRCREIAQAYEAGGAAALSVLTEEDYFQGSLADLIDARDATGLPVLRKDFILDAYQVYESAAAGADALLLIVSVLAEGELRGLIELCGRLKLAALVEAHTEAEIEKAVEAGAQIIGINNRNLKTMEVRLETSFRLREKIPAACLAVSESGIKTAEDLRRMNLARFNAVLMGETLMLAGDPGRELARLIEGATAHGVVRR